MAVKQKKCTRETLLTVFRNWSAAMSFGFPLTLRLFHVGHPWTPFPVFLPEHVALKHAILSAQVILRTGNGNSERVCLCMHSYMGLCAHEKSVVAESLKQDMLGITQSTKSVTWSETQGWFIWLQKESVACGLEERMFSFFAPSVLRHNTWKHFERPWVCKKSFSPSFHCVLAFQTDWVTYICSTSVEKRIFLMNNHNALQVWTYH